MSILYAVNRCDMQCWGKSYLCVVGNR